MLDGIDREGGLLALAGTKDMREVLERAAAGDEPAGLALDVYLHRLVAGLAAMTASLGGIDALVFTGGIGERSAELRRRAVAGLAFLGIGVDGGANDRLDGEDAEITGRAPGRGCWWSLPARTSRSPAGPGPLSPPRP